LKEALKRSGGYATLAADILAKYYEATGDSAAAEEINLAQLKINRLD